MIIDVFCRIRDGNLKIIPNKNNKVIQYYYLKKDHNFIVNDVWNNTVKNFEIFNTLLNKSKKQVNYWITFGYTGSGKTYTTNGIMEELLYNFQNENVLFNAIQIYNNEIYDLLDNNKNLKYYKTNNLIIRGKKEIKITKNINRVLTCIKNNRVKASTYMNQNSSRSHAIFTIKVKDKKYIIVDMAGQESMFTTKKCNKVIQKQATNINLNMLALKECITSFKNNNNHIPFRRSLLTFALKPLFTLNCYVGFICNLSINHNPYYQIDSLKYASSLYDGKNEKYVNNELFKNFTEYIQEVGWLNCEEKKVWMEMKKGNYSNLNKINEYIKKKMKWIKKFNNYLYMYYEEAEIYPENKYDENEKNEENKKENEDIIEKEKEIKNKTINNKTQLLITN
tara:strand:+ start:190 stop:1371 length:1182 start_codon:yes stop_codon:yes gene_type:complete